MGIFNEQNTFATSVYINSPIDEVHAYLMELKNLNEWTLFSRMKEKIDAHTWKGTASGYHHDLYYHVREIKSETFKGIEWHCGLEYQNYYQVYPVLLFPASSMNPASRESGTYLHWISFVDPARRTAMIKEAIDVVHTSECRSLKARLEQRNGQTQASIGQMRVDSDTIYIDAPVSEVVKLIGDIRQFDKWAHLYKKSGAVTPERGEFTDEYGRNSVVSHKVHDVGLYSIVDQRCYYPEYNNTQHSLALVIPTSYALGNQTARGCFHHRVTFWNQSEQSLLGRLVIEDFGAEAINIKRFAEAAAGNMSTFSLGISYKG
ncbi:MAG TPA: scytonemin biosynthesis cyclase/decarboxylase ScyC [Oligoflexus sp.]|uniref:scytonemin biosynthesis cyclase/decarboxylase ScyC n=1 Tax=Oligoflexus sp. TaxID=1971216 RepID=UPI002D45D8B5|nr:scytonemin biosynthesis cyclase/decarboxylase ScyC [Oligoflexus sp.]HYX39095.1 scytonemin biosynthesis cyclase/decarboxylase ScyC [Oligoflexus sp.]